MRAATSPNGAHRMAKRLDVAGFRVGASPMHFLTEAMFLEWIEEVWSLVG